MLRAMEVERSAGPTVTHADLHYVGSATIDADLVDVSDPLSRR